MKRLREDKHEYLGGDLLIEGEDEEHGGDMSKADRNLARKLANKKWKLVDRKVGSGIDPAPRHTNYYRAQLADLADAEEWSKFQSSLVQPLPVTFRFGGCCPDAVKNGLKALFNGTFRTMKGRFVEINGTVLNDDIVKPVVWPGADVYQVAADSLTLSKNEGLEPLSTVLRREVKLGHVVRQELASMIPALLLRVEGHHNVLDLCAAPGSKTEQLLAIMQQHAWETVRAHRATGMVVANDPDPDRIRTLKMRYDKCLLPNFLITCATAEDLAKQITDGPVFDRILADVPCSGDGTIRKFPHIWRLFRPRMAIELHTIQLQIALSGVSMLKRGGRMVYSTCSINPIEDEAVVAAMLRAHWVDGLRLVDTRAAGMLPLLHSRPGISAWRCDSDIFVAGEADSTRQETLKRLPPLAETLFPPTEQEVRLFNLDRCHRILPHDNDTGGFFVAVFELHDLSKDTVIRDSCKELTTGASSSLSNSKRGKDAVDVMKQLGYNPKRLAKKPKLAPTRNHDSRKSSRPTAPEDAVGVAYTACSAANVNRMSHWLKIPLPSEVNSIEAACKGERVVLSNRRSPTGELEFSLVSPNVMQALDTWAQPRGNGGSAAGYCLIHAGAPVVFEAAPRRDLRWGLSATVECDRYSLSPYGAQVLRPLVNLSHICDLNKRDFIKLATMNLLDEPEEASMLLRILFLDALGPVDVDQGEGGVLSSAGLQAMGVVMRDVAELETSSPKVVHIFVSHKCSAVAATAAGGDEDSKQKKRLSKAERKKMKQGRSMHSTGYSQVGEELPEMAGIVTNESVSSSLREVEALIVIRCDFSSFQSSGDAAADTVVFFSNAQYSFVTSTDICQSYVDAISVVAV